MDIRVALKSDDIQAVRWGIILSLRSAGEVATLDIRTVVGCVEGEDNVRNDDDPDLVDVIMLLLVLLLVLSLVLLLPLVADEPVTSALDVRGVKDAVDVGVNPPREESCEDIDRVEWSRGVVMKE